MVSAPSSACEDALQFSKNPRLSTGLSVKRHGEGRRRVDGVVIEAHGLAVLALSFRVRFKIFGHEFHLSASSLGAGWRVEMRDVG
jgi:hypothetical protein